MADIHHVISLGIGSPADIPHFILFGLSINDVVIPVVYATTEMVGTYSLTTELPGTYSPTTEMVGVYQPTTESAGTV